MGALRLSRLTRLEYIVGRTANDISGRFSGMSRLLLERSVLFLHDRQFENKRDIRHDAEWLKTRLRIVETSKLQAVRKNYCLHLLTFVMLADNYELCFKKRTLRHGKVVKEDVQYVSAAIIPSQSGHVDLYLASNMEIDYFEIATGLCKTLLHRQRPVSTSYCNRDYCLINIYVSYIE